MKKTYYIVFLLRLQNRLHKIGQSQHNYSGEDLTQRYKLPRLVVIARHTQKVRARDGDGVIRDPKIRQQVLLDVLGFAQQEGFGIRGPIKSPLLGPKGDAEFLAWLGSQGSRERCSCVRRTGFFNVVFYS